MNYPSSSVLRLLLLLLPILQAAALAGREGDAADARFVAWSRAHNKTYPNRAAAAKAEANFLANDDFISRHNRANASFMLGHNAYSDLSRAEYRVRFLRPHPPQAQPRPIFDSHLKGTLHPAAARRQH